MVLWNIYNTFSFCLICIFYSQWCVCVHQCHKNPKIPTIFQFYIRDLISDESITFTSLHGTLSLFSMMESVPHNKTIYNHYIFPPSFRESVKHLYHFPGGLWVVLVISDETLSSKQHIDKRTARFCRRNPHRWPWREVMFAQVWAYADELTLISKLAWMWGRKTISSSSHSCLSSLCIRPLILHLCRPSRINTYIEIFELLYECCCIQ